MGTTHRESVCWLIERHVISASAAKPGQRRVYSRKDTNEAPRKLLITRASKFPLHAKSVHPCQYTHTLITTAAPSPEGPQIESHAQRERITISVYKSASLFGVRLLGSCNNKTAQHLTSEACDSSRGFASWGPAHQRTGSLLFQICLLAFGNPSARDSTRSRNARAKPPPSAHTTAAVVLALLCARRTLLETPIASCMASRSHSRCISRLVHSARRALVVLDSSRQQVSLPCTTSSSMPVSAAQATMRQVALVAGAAVARAFGRLSRTIAHL